jgi:hypothetical protein
VNTACDGRRPCPGLGSLTFWLLLGCTSAPLEGETDAPAPTPMGPERAPEELGVILHPGAENRSATALAFNPLRPDELWVTLRQPESGLPCTTQVQTGCAALEGRVVVIAGASTAEPSAEVKKDDNAWHFMRRPSSIAFGLDGLFATCGESRTANFEDESVPFTGPALWTSDPAIFGQPATGEQNGKHVDMLHETPFCMGLAHEQDNVYWAFNGDAGALDRYDFNAPHEIGGDDHSDGELVRYAASEVRRVAGVPSHLAYDSASGLLYAADTGNKRIARLYPDTGSPAGANTAYEPLAVNVQVSGARLETFATGLGAPSGLVLYQDVLIVSDNATSAISIYDLQGRRIASVPTGLPAGSLAGIAVGPDERLYVADLRSGSVIRVHAEILNLRALLDGR